MLIYSKTINIFLQRLRKRARHILRHEMGLTVNNRYLLWQEEYIPFELVAFQSPSLLGYFDPTYSRIGINRELFYRARPEVLDNVLRHELAHLYTFLLYPHLEQVSTSHGREFQEVCLKFKWGKEVSCASGSLSQGGSLEAQSDEFDKILRRIQKLLSLAGSNNPHEAESATLKANELLLKYNIQALEGEGHFWNSSEQEVFVKCVATAKRHNTLLSSLSQILNHFCVQCISQYGHKQVSLQVVGSRLNVELADYVAKYLLYEFEHLWKKTKRENPHLKGITQKNSYLRGLAAGFIERLEKQKTNTPHTHKKSLMRLQEDLQEQVKLAYPRLSFARSNQIKVDPHTLSLGTKHGSQISVNAALEKSSKPTLQLN